MSQRCACQSSQPLVQVTRKFQGVLTHVVVQEQVHLRTTAPGTAPSHHTLAAHPPAEAVRGHAPRQGMRTCLFDSPNR
eukprot:scaffold51_cov401-Prasinococcus_capsulatus_cf.AAC.41